MSTHRALLWSSSKGDSGVVGGGQDLSLGTASPLIRSVPLYVSHNFYSLISFLFKKIFLYFSVTVIGIQYHISCRCTT